MSEEDEDIWRLEIGDHTDGEDFLTPTWVGKAFGFFDHQRRQVDEVLALIELNIPSDVLDWDVHDDGVWIFKYPEVEVRIATDLDSSCFFCAPQVLDPNYTLNRTCIDPLRLRLRGIGQVEGLNMDKFYDFALIVLRILEETSATLSSEARSSEIKAWRASEVERWESVLDNPLGVDLSTIHDTAFHILRKTPEQICERICAPFRILHVESVLRHDLASRFFKSQSEIRQRLQAISNSSLAKCIPFDVRIDKHDEKIEYLTRSRLTFHGTQRHTVRSIVQYGFVKPGKQIGNTGQILEIRCGNTYGCGVYSSPFADFALSYTGQFGLPTSKADIPSLKLIVCATIMGRPAAVSRADNWREYSYAMDGADSHVGNNGHEYIVFDERQILPCYVIHLDWGAEEARKALESVPDDSSIWIEQNKNKKHPKLVKETIFPGDKEREKAAKQAAAAKWFPYGYGPATGTSLKIEEIGEVSDDEENYGEYQDEKIAEGGRKREQKLGMIKEGYERAVGKLSIFDEYFDAKYE
jgi:hypothetical protein